MTEKKTIKKKYKFDIDDIQKILNTETITKPYDKQEIIIVSIGNNHYEYRIKNFIPLFNYIIQQYDKTREPIIPCLEEKVKLLSKSEIKLTEENEKLKKINDEQKKQILLLEEINKNNDLDIAKLHQDNNKNITQIAELKNSIIENERKSQKEIDKKVQVIEHKLEQEKKEITEKWQNSILEHQKERKELKKNYDSLNEKYNHLQAHFDDIMIRYNDSSEQIRKLKDIITAIIDKV